MTTIKKGDSRWNQIYQYGFYDPIKGKRTYTNPKYKGNKKNGGVIPHCNDERIKLVPIGCGKCEECRRKKSGEWRVRLEQEFIHNKQKYRFITLTFNEKALKKYLELAREEINNKKKEDTKNGYDIRNIACKIAVRRWLERIRKDKKKSVRHWLITELGGDYLHSA